jgi:hypothetical protein
MDNADRKNQEQDLLPRIGADEKTSYWLLAIGSWLCILAFSAHPR